MKQRANSALAFAMAFVCAASLLGMPKAAWADENNQDAAAKATAGLSIKGVDCLEPSSTAWELMRVDRLGDDALYLDVAKTENGKTTYLMMREKYTTAANQATEGTGAQVAQIVALNLAADGGFTANDAFGDINNRASYTVAVYGAARGGEPLYEATVYPVYAQLVDGEGNVVGINLMGLRTASADEAAMPRNIGAGTTYYANLADGADRTAYRLVTTAGIDNAFDAEGSCFVVTYEQAADNAVSGSITYVDTEGNVVKRETVPGVTAEGVHATIEKSFFVDGVYYRVIQNLTGTDVVLTETNAHRTVRVIEVDGMTTDSYQVTIRYVDENGNQLWSDDLDIKGDGYQYTLPDTFSMNGTDGVELYTLRSVKGDLTNAGNGIAPQAAQHEWSNPVRFERGIDPNAFDTDPITGRRVLNAVYGSSSVSKEAELTIVEVDGSTGTQLGREVLLVTPEQTAVYTPAEKTVDGVTYVPWVGNTTDVTCAWADLADGVELMRYVYYVPEGYTPSQAYDITVQYMNIADSSILRTETITVDPGMTDYMNIKGEERFQLNGNEYVRLNGQEEGVNHTYYSPARTYTFYYRDVNDELSSSIVVTRTEIITTDRVITLPGGTIIVPATATPAPQVPVTTPAVVDDGGAAPVAPVVDDGLTPGQATVIDDDNNPLAPGTLTNNEGNDPTTAREESIDDENNPLGPAAPAYSTTDNSDAASFELPMAAVVGIAAAVILAAGLIAFFVKRRRDEEKNNTGRSVRM